MALRRTAYATVGRQRSTHPAVANASKDIFDLPCTKFSIDHAEGGNTSQDMVWPLQPVDRNLMVTEEKFGKRTNLASL
jgi:hypothetical protein